MEVMWAYSSDEKLVSLATRKCMLQMFRPRAFKYFNSSRSC